MRRSSSSRTPPWRGRSHEKGRRRERGAATAAVLLLSVVFAALALTALSLSGLYMRSAGHRKSATLLDYASENGLKRGLHELLHALGSAAGLAAVEDGLLDVLRAKPGEALSELLVGGFGVAFPRTVDESLDGMAWTSRAELAGARIREDRRAYLYLSASLQIQSTGRLSRADAARTSSLEGTLGLLVGRFPLAALPLLIKRSLPEEERRDFLEDRSIRLERRPGELLPPQLASLPEPFLQEEWGPLVAKALNVKMFRPEELSPANLRAALGLEPSTEPVPDGVYLVRSDIGLGGIFVQGDLDELALAAADGTQHIVFRVRNSEWRLEFSPSRGQTVFRTPDGELSFDLVPIPIILVDGAVASLGGGEIGPDGRLTMSMDPERAAVLDGIGLTIVCSKRVVISSHLVLEGVRWQDGIPYLKESQAQLLIGSTGRDVFGEATDESGLLVSAEAPRDLRIQAVLTTAGTFAIEGADKTVLLAGSLHARDLEGRGSSLALFRDDRAAEGVLPEDAPRAALPYAIIHSITVASWKEY